jgi:RHH-type proline utilization regulon transcriptional repressor/proline dehydrogenase/delta 1-pyrroline-5-carboxylate dehydrogenase
MQPATASTLGIHSRIDANIKTIQKGVKVGNIYINRNMIGAVVGVQPFGGMELSGTGPKAGGPDYLRRFAIEQTVTTKYRSYRRQCQFTG